MSNRPDFKSYLKYHYRKILGTTYESQAITCRSGKVYAMVNNTLYKVLRALILGAVIIILMQTQAYMDMYNRGNLLLIVVSYFAFIVLTKLLQYFLARYEELDDTSILSLDHASRFNRPPFWDYVKNVYKGYSELTIFNDFKDKDGQKYCERSIIDRNIFLALVLSLWVLGGSFYSLITNIVIFLGLILLYLVISPVRYLYAHFIKICNQDNHTATLNTSDSKQRTKRSKIKNSITFLLCVVVIIYLIFSGPYPLSNIFTQRIKSGDIPVTEQTTFEEAYEIAHTYADQHCGDTELLGYHISFEGEAAIKTRQPTNWMLDFQHLPAGLFDPNQKINIDKTSETHMTAYRYIPTQRVSIQNAPTIPDINKILTIVEDDLSIVMEDTSSLTISGGSASYQQLPVNTFEVSMGFHSYIVDVVSKTVHQEY